MENEGAEGWARDERRLAVGGPGEGELEGGGGGDGDREGLRWERLEREEGWGGGRCWVCGQGGSECAVELGVSGCEGLEVCLRVRMDERRRCRRAPKRTERRVSGGDGPGG